MEPVTIIVSALVAGASAGITSVAEQGIKEAYNALKALIKDRFGEKRDLVSSVDLVEQTPESPGRREMLKEELSKAEVGKDAEVVRAAQELLALLQPKSATQQLVADHGSAVATEGGTAQVGDSNIALTGDIQGGVTIGHTIPRTE